MVFFTVYTPHGLLQSQSQQLANSLSHDASFDQGIELCLVLSNQHPCSNRIESRGEILWLVHDFLYVANSAVSTDINLTLCFVCTCLCYYLLCVCVCVRACVCPVCI